jgi:hypothetical protein
MTDTLLKNIRPLVEQMQGLARQAHAEYSREVDAVILSRSRDPQRIEHLLDGILSFCFDPEMLQLYKKLCRHYYFISPAATADYVYAYRDMWDSDYVETARLHARKKSGVETTNSKRTPARKARL